MDLASTRIITDDLDRLVGFYELVTGGTFDRLAPVFAELRTPVANLAIGHTDSLALFDATEILRGAANASVIVEFRVADVEAEYARLETRVEDWIQGPTTMPWGNRSILMRDPDGNLVNLFQPVTEAAIARFGE